MAKKKDYNYFEKFVELVDYSCQCAEILHTTLLNFNPDTLPEKLKEIHNIEHAADLEKHDLIHNLAIEFIAPIEREDIISLSQEIDDITDSVEDVLIKIHMFNITSIRPEAIKFSKLIKKCCLEIKSALEDFQNFKKSTTLHDKVVEINRLEEEGDSLYYDSVHTLFSNQKNPVDLLVWTEIFNRMEKCCDSCEVTANNIETIAMKNS